MKSQVHGGAQSAISDSSCDEGLVAKLKPSSQAYRCNSMACFFILTFPESSFVSDCAI